MYYSDEPLKDFDRYDADQQAKLDKLPKCSDCGKSIQDEHFYLINDEAICQNCLDSNYRKDIEDYIE